MFPVDPMLARVNKVLGKDVSKQRIFESIEDLITVVEEQRDEIEKWQELCIFHADKLGKWIQRAIQSSVIQEDLTLQLNKAKSEINHLTKINFDLRFSSRRRLLDKTLRENLELTEQLQEARTRVQFLEGMRSAK